MKVLEIKATEGPNYWSIRRHNLIVMLLDLEDLEERPTNLIDGFHERLKTLIPSLQEHRCSEDRPGGFFHRVKEGTWMGHVIEHIALEIQSLAGMNCGFGRTRGSGEKGRYHVVFAYEDMSAGKYAAAAAVRIASALVEGSAYDLQQDITAMESLAAKNKMGPSTRSIVDEAIKRNIPVIRLDDDSLVQLGYGSAQKRIEATITSNTSNIAVDLAGNKAATKNLLEANYLPVPKGRKFYQEEELQEIIDEIGFPVVIKPLDGNQGKGATTDIRSFEEALIACKIAKDYGTQLICEKFIQGSDFRALVVNYKFQAAALRTPANVRGDGVHTVRQLINKANSDPKRGDGHENSLTKIKIDDLTINFLARQVLSLDSVLPMGKEVFLKPTANLSTGGTAMDVTDDVHPENVKIFERVARLIGLDICGIDIMATSLREPITQNGGAIIEVNAAPGFRMHLHPTEGQPRNVAAPVIDMLFPDTVSSRIPIIAITGTNGKTTTSRLLAHITSQAGYKVGYTTTDGIYIDGQMVVEGDCTGPVSTRTVLKDPLVNMAVLECARGGILRGGLGFDQCDVGIVTNVAEDHLGLGGIDCLEKLARVKATVAESVSREGYAVLNADDDLVYEMRKNVSCRVALFSMDRKNPRIIEHTRKGGLAAVYESNFVTILNGKTTYRIGRVQQMPITFEGAANFNIANVLAATLAAYVQKIHPKTILEALKSFVPCAETIPGRMNVFQFPMHKVIVDYAHNMHGVKSMGAFINTLPATRKIGVITGVGDRRSQDITALGTEAARIFDEIIIRHDNDLRGRNPEEIDRLICEGIHIIDPSKKITIINDEIQAVDEVLKNPVNGSVSVIFADNIKEVVRRIKEASQQRQIKQELEVA
jgi:cyanophycin synthetase